MKNSINGLDTLYGTSLSSAPEQDKNRFPRKLCWSSSARHQAASAESLGVVVTAPVPKMMAFGSAFLQAVTNAGGKALLPRKEVPLSSVLKEGNFERRARS